MFYCCGQYISCKLSSNCCIQYPVHALYVAGSIWGGQLLLISRKWIFSWTAKSIDGACLISWRKTVVGVWSSWKCSRSKVPYYMYMYMLSHLWFRNTQECYLNTTEAWKPPCKYANPTNSLRDALSGPRTSQLRVYVHVHCTWLGSVSTKFTHSCKFHRETCILWL